MALLEQFLTGPRCDELIFDIVSKIVPVPIMLERYGLTVDELQLLLLNGIFADRVRQAAASWNSTVNVGERIRLRAQYQVEDGQIALTKILHDDKTPAATRIDAIQTLADLAQVGKRALADKITPTLGDRFQITFNFRGVEPQVIEGTKSLNHDLLESDEA